MGGNKHSKLDVFKEELSYLDIGGVEMKLLYKTFRKVATTSEQEVVTVSEILQYSEVTYTDFAARALCCGFCYTDASESAEDELKKINDYKFDFKEYVCTLWNVLTLCPEAFNSFIFSIYDADGGGTIDPQEAQTMLKDIHGDNFRNNLEALRQYNKLSMLVRKNINAESFGIFATENRNLFQPAYDLQTKLSTKIMGTLFWTLHTKKRKQLYLYKYKHVTRVMDKVRVMRQKEKEAEWLNGNIDLPVDPHINKSISAKEDSSAPDILILDGSPSENENNPPSIGESSLASQSDMKNKSGTRASVTFAEDVNDNPSVTPVKFKKSITSKYFFGSRPNTPSKQLSYFLERFYEKPGEIKMTEDRQRPLTPYSLIRTANEEKPSVISAVQRVVDSNVMVRERRQAAKKSKKEKKKEILKSVTDVRTFQRGQDFLNKQNDDDPANSQKNKKKLTKGQLRLMKTRQMREKMMSLRDEEFD